MRRTGFLAGGAAALAMAAPAGAQPLARLRVGVSTAETYAEGFYADDQGFFKRAGIAPEITMLANGGALIAAVIGGSLDVAPANIIALASAHARGLPIVILASGAQYVSNRTTHAIVVSKDSTLHTARDLAGKTLALTGLRSLEELAIRNWIDTNGGDSTKTSFIELPNSGQVPALTSHRIDCAMMPEPWITDGKNETRIFCKPFDSIADKFLITAWFTTQGWLDANRALAQRFVGSMERTAVWTNANPRASGEILSKQLHVPLATVEGMVRTSMAETLNPELIQPILDVGVKYAFLAKNFPAREMFARLNG